MKKEIKWVELGEICEFSSGLIVSLNKNKKLKTNILEKQLPFLKVTNLKEESGIDIQKCDWIDFCEGEKGICHPEQVMIATRGSAGKLGFNNLKIDVAFYSNICKLVPNQKQVNQRYLFWALIAEKETIENATIKSGTPMLTISRIKKFRIPLPSLEKQEKIAKWLDAFSSLERQLERQLERHKSRYKYYLNRLMRGGQRVELKGIVNGLYRGSPFTKSQITFAGIPCIRYGEIYTIYDIWFDKAISHIELETKKTHKYCCFGDLLITRVGEKISEVAKPLVFLGKEKVIIDDGIFVLKHVQSPKYLAYSLSCQSIIQQKKQIFDLGVAVQSIRSEQLLKLKIPLPSLDRQEKIANWLDKFRTLTDNISKGLPREILLLKQQSKYYRERLIS